MRVLYVITRSDVIGGASVHLLDLAEGIAAIGHNVQILVGGGGIFVELAKKRGLDVKSLNYLVREISLLRDVRAIQEICRKIAEFSPDIMHLHSSKAGVVGRVAARLHNVPAIFTAHGWAFTDGVSRNKQKFYCLIERFLARMTRKIITVSEYDRKLALEKKVGTPDSILTVHNGVRDINFPCSTPQDERFVKFIMVARFDEQKDHELLLRSLSRLKKRCWSMELVGDGPLQEASRRLAAQLGLEDRILFSGYCSDVEQRIGASNVLVLASKWEGLPLTVIEAMRGGLPVVASNVGGVSELVIEGVTGFLTERGSESDMTDSLTTILENFECRASMGKAARKRYEQLFSFEMMRNRTVAVYKSVLNEAKA